MKNSFFTSIRFFFGLSVLTGLAYPLAVTLPAKLLFAEQAEGSLILRDGKAVGSRLVSQKTTSEKYFWARPSGTDHNPLPSSGTNQGPTSAALKKAVEERRAALEKAHPGQGEIPADLLYASGSGLDPHLSPEAATYQALRVAKARKLDLAKVQALVESQVERPQFGLLGQSRINVLELNLALDAL